jgi:hypothetical protein
MNGSNYELILPMKKRKIKSPKKKKYYLLISKKDNFQYGVFPHTKEGLIHAKNYLTKITTKPELYSIKSK